MKEIEYVKIDKNFLLKQHKFLRDNIDKIDSIPFDENTYPREEIVKLRTSFQDLSFIISKTEPI